MGVWNFKEKVIFFIPLNQDDDRIRQRWTPRPRVVLPLGASCLGKGKHTVPLTYLQYLGGICFCGF